MHLVLGTRAVQKKLEAMVLVLDNEVVDKWQTHKTLQGPENSRHVARVQEDGKSLWDGTVREYCTEQVGFEPNLDE